MNDNERLELELLLEAIRRKYGYDFRDYSRASLIRRLRHRMHLLGIADFSALQHRVLHDEETFQRVVGDLSVSVTEMFRDPDVYHAIRAQVVPELRDCSHLKVWHAGCATGEEVYSLAIVLREEGLYDRTQIYATDINLDLLRKAKEGIYPVERLQLYTANYQKAGGRASFSDYYRADDRFAVLDGALKRNILFADHNLVTDGVFGEMQLILCRNTLIYFNRDLQERVLQLFRDSLAPRGFLCLGSKESVRYSSSSTAFEEIAAGLRLYRLRG